MKKLYTSLLLLGVSVLFLLFFSYMTSSLFPFLYGWDSAFFQMVGAGMTKGYIPYRDFFDMKGPWLFFIEYIGQLFCYGRTGIFLMQCINLWITLLFCHKIWKKYFGGNSVWSSLMVMLPLFIVMASTMEGGNLTEEWSLPLLFGSLYLALEFVHGEEKEHKPFYGFCYGVCFGVLALNRITNAVMICAIVLTVLIFLVGGRKWKNLLLNAAAFLAGIFTAFVPPLLYYGYFGKIKDMLYCTFVFGFIYGTEGFAVGTGILFFITLFFPVVVLLLLKEENKRFWTLIISNTAGMMITLGMGNSTLHDYMLIMPGMMLGIGALAQGLKEKWMTPGRRGVMLVLLVICLAYPCYKAAQTGAGIIRQASDRSTYDNVMETAACIPEMEKDSVWGYEVPLHWYVIADILPYSRYCGWQEHYMQLSPQIETEINVMLREAPPKWIVTKATANLENEIVVTQLRDHYHIYMENSDFILYQRMEDNDF